MYLQQNLNVRLEQQLLLAPQLQQAVKLLLYNGLELNHFLQQEVLENPFLEMDISSYSESIVPLESIQKKDLYFDKVDYHFVGDDDFKDDRESYDEHPLFSREENYKKDLLEELKFSCPLEDYFKEIVCLLINELDEEGFLKTPLFELSDAYGVSYDDFAKALDYLREMREGGLGSFDTKDFLLYRLEKDPSIEIEKKKKYAAILKNALDVLLGGKFDLVKKEYQLTPLDLKGILFFIYKVGLKPIGDLEEEQGKTAYINHPDVILTIKDGVFLLNLAKYHDLNYNESLYRQVKEKEKLTGEEDSFISEKAKSASWLISTLDYRSKSLMEVVREIIHFQEAFFRNESPHPRAMILKDIASRVNLHESTVSRLTTNKYLSCPRGFFELKYFFTNKTVGEEDQGVLMIKERIKEIIESGPKDRPFSDDKVRELLGRDNIVLARRTVAKYREEMGILNAAQRKLTHSLSH